MRLWIRNPLGIVADNASGGVVVEGGVIAELVAAGTGPAAPVDGVFDASEHVVLPGLINTHHHFYQTLTRAHPAAIDRELFPWLTALYPLWARLTPEHLRLAVRAALAELLLSGCTTAADHHYLYPPGLEDAVDIAVEEARALGIRATISRGSMNLSQKDGGLPPDTVVQEEDTILADSERVLRLFHDPAPGSMIQIALAPCSPFSVTPSLMAKSAELAARFDAPLHTHLAETKDEDAYCLQVYGKRPLDLLEETGWMRPKTWLAHGVHFSCEECDRLGRAGVGVCHCPTSNGVLASGFCRTRELEAAGAPLGLGVDGSASNDGSNLMEELRHALLVNRLRYESAAAVTARDVIRWATQGSARCLGRSDIGTIAPGFQADLALYRLDELRFSGAHDPVAALVLCGAHKADRVMVAGRWRVVDGAIPGLDLAALRRAHGAASRRYA
ncbi:MAG: 8-oxoguanine deaminase [Bosea sp. (in: a-proteobacteria)]|uniref:8-oxoguanine deaminase n=1 Tax=Bosea sp. (in: a-proteobacteria) TaxID=1871050 RepID=UPI000AD695B9|nr:8-oxoguanine deaminase [Bosea sp. (in: a-proteobacteria)]MDP3602732.1 8-oxoguanine deaminase [Bosea sp. (in: a-proteobacteria)]